VSSHTPSRARDGAPPRRRLTRERLAKAALALIDRDGLEAFSTRKLGAALRVEAMAVYHHFPSKEHLLDAVAERLVTSVALPDERLDWVDWLRRAAHDHRAIARRHPNAFPLLAMRRFTTPESFRRLEAHFRVLRRAGFSARETASVFRALGYFINGAALAEVATRAALADPARRTALDDFADEAFPHVAEVAPHLRLAGLDDIFSFGLEALLERFAVLRDGKRR
jgi:AcrR family transcriptional regulator